MADPAFPRDEPPYDAPERAMLIGWLEFHRATLAWKCGGLDDAQLRLRSVMPSALSLLGLIRHMADVERGWFANAWAARGCPTATRGPMSRRRFLRGRRCRRRGGV